jgi:hypothetical protein
MKVETPAISYDAAPVENLQGMLAKDTLASAVAWCAFVVAKIGINPSTNSTASSVASYEDTMLTMESQETVALSPVFGTSCCTFGISG